jgi:UDP-glucose 4-epimerase
MTFEGLAERNRYLITGGTGSFGRTMVDHLRKFATVRVLSRDEAKQDQMRQELNDPNVEYWVGDIRDFDRVREAMQDVNFVFHAAALKQVPACENWPAEAVKTNVIGADNVMRAAIEQQVLKCVLLSTDKAVYPVSAMGTSKAMMEKLMLARSHHAGNTVLCATRYGNVMDSRGSVIPLFCKQLTDGNTLTVTDSRMTRFLMSLEESVDLVIYAFGHAQPGDIFVKKVPACRIADLASALLALSGRSEPVLLTGIRPGEKLHESLVSSEEASRLMTFEPYWRILRDSYGGQRSGDYNSMMAEQLTVHELMQLLKTLPCVQELMR